MGTVTHFFTFTTHSKKRWWGHSLIDVMTTEFRTRTREYYVEAIRCGVVTVNNKKVTENYVMRNQDTIYHTVHIHEPLPPAIKVIIEGEDYSVIHKPAGIPVHPTGEYFYYTVTKALYPDRKVGCVNRLDLPVSGVLILVFKNHHKIHLLLENAKKVYVALVAGEFPESVEVNKPIETSNGNRHFVSDDGKPSRTLFKRIKYKNGYSLVECQPITGRTHQIRIHLKYLGFPVVNDKLYGKEEPEKNEYFGPMGCSTDISEYEDKDKYMCVLKFCKAEQNRAFRVVGSFICLHAWKYEFDGKTYEADWPEWANL